ncbi:unnamed protein product [Amoebophrya sp. A25]|nr:unnamed protein product [Amoebophrya sp. A25]|eukprot:GSA25T00017646001.1
MTAIVSANGGTSGEQEQERLTPIATCDVVACSIVSPSHLAVHPLVAHPLDPLTVPKSIALTAAETTHYRGEEVQAFLGGFHGQAFLGEKAGLSGNKDLFMILPVRHNAEIWNSKLLRASLSFTATKMVKVVALAGGVGIGEPQMLTPIFAYGVVFPFASLPEVHLLARPLIYDDFRAIRTIPTELQLPLYMYVPKSINVVLTLAEMLTYYNGEKAQLQAFLGGHQRGQTFLREHLHHGQAFLGEKAALLRNYKELFTMLPVNASTNFEDSCRELVQGRRRNKTRVSRREAIGDHGGRAKGEEKSKKLRSSCSRRSCSTFARRSAAMAVASYAVLALQTNNDQRPAKHRPTSMAGDVNSQGETDIEITPEETAFALVPSSGPASFVNVNVKKSSAFGKGISLFATKFLGSNTPKEQDSGSLSRPPLMATSEDKDEMEQVSESSTPKEDSQPQPRYSYCAPPEFAVSSMTTLGVPSVLGLTSDEYTGLKRAGREEKRYRLNAAAKDDENYKLNDYSCLDLGPSNTGSGGYYDDETGDLVDESDYLFFKRKASTSTDSLDFANAWKSPGSACHSPLLDARPRPRQLGECVLMKISQGEASIGNTDQGAASRVDCVITTCSNEIWSRPPRMVVLDGYTQYVDDEPQRPDITKEERLAITRHKISNIDERKPISRNQLSHVRQIDSELHALQVQRLPILSKCVDLSEGNYMFRTCEEVSFDEATERSVSGSPSNILCLDSSIEWDDGTGYSALNVDGQYKFVLERQDGFDPANADAFWKKQGSPCNVDRRLKAPRPPPVEVVLQSIVDPESIVKKNRGGNLLTTAFAEGVCMVKEEGKVACTSEVDGFHRPRAKEDCRDEQDKAGYVKTYYRTESVCMRYCEPPKFAVTRSGTAGGNEIAAVVGLTDEATYRSLRESEPSASRQAQFEKIKQDENLNHHSCLDLSTETHSAAYNTDNNAAGLRLDYDPAFHFFTRKASYGDNLNYKFLFLGFAGAWKGVDSECMLSDGTTIGKCVLEEDHIHGCVITTCQPQGVA